MSQFHHLDMLVLGKKDIHQFFTTVNVGNLAKRGL